MAEGGTFTYEEHGEIPDGAVVMFRSDWHERWATQPDRYNEKPFPGVALETAKYLREEKDIPFHGHEPLDTDTTAGLPIRRNVLKHFPRRAGDRAQFEQRRSL